jgi:hypothetical protein
VELRDAEAGGGEQIGDGGNECGRVGAPGQLALAEQVDRAGLCNLRKRHRAGGAAGVDSQHEETRSSR